MINIEKLTKILGDAGLIPLIDFEFGPTGKDGSGERRLYVSAKTALMQVRVQWYQWIPMADALGPEDLTMQLAKSAVDSAVRTRSEILAGLAGLDEAQRRLESAHVTMGSAQRDSLKVGA